MCVICDAGDTHDQYAQTILDDLCDQGDMGELHDLGNA